MTANLAKIAGAVGAFFLLAACASTPAEGPDLNADARGDQMVDQNAGPTPGTQAHLEQTAGHRVLFALDQYTLSPQAQATLASQAAWLKEYPEATVTVAGNCDERGTREYNLALGARRAEAARAYLVSLGVESNRIRTVSYGKERPIDPRSTEEAWSLNRNATTTLNSVGS